MSAEQIKSALKQLHADLEATPRVDPELRSLLEDLDRDIQKLLRPGTPASPDAAGLVGRVEAVAADFEVKHPNVAGVLRRLADGLGQMGV